MAGALLGAVAIRLVNYARSRVLDIFWSLMQNNLLITGIGGEKGKKDSTMAPRSHELCSWKKAIVAF